MKISVVIPAYNSEQTIGRAIDSVLGQTRPAEEIIVVDDGSTDRTAERVRAYGDKVRLIQQPNAGVSVARNAAIAAATGDWIAFLDADDEWLPKKLRLQTQQLNRFEDLKWAFTNFYRKTGVSQEPIITHAPAQFASLLKNDAWFEDYLKAEANGANTWTTTILVRKSVFDTVGLFVPGMKRAQDVDVWYRIAYQYPQVGYLAEPLAVYHMDTLASSTKVNDQVNDLIGFLDRHVRLAQQHDRYASFFPCMVLKVQDRIRQYLRQKRYADIRILLHEYEQHLDKRFLNEVRFRLVCPSLCSPLAETVHWAKRRLRR
jgi:glycosyltransferase involved in cell wall biosynthesis